MSLMPFTGRGRYGGGITDPFGALTTYDPFADFFGGAGGALAPFGGYGGGFGGLLGGGLLGGMGGAMTPVDVRETDKDFQIIADTPGMNPEDITVDVDESTITVRGEHKDVSRQTDPATGRVYRSERSRRSFTRSFTLPPGADPNNVQANLDRGVLTVSISKKPEEQGKTTGRRIPITGGGAATTAGGGTTPTIAGAGAAGAGTRTTPTTTPTKGAGATRT